MSRRPRLCIYCRLSCAAGLGRKGGPLRALLIFILCPFALTWSIGCQSPHATSAVQPVALADSGAALALTTARGGRASDPMGEHRVQSCLQRLQRQAGGDTIDVCLLAAARPNAYSLPGGIYLTCGLYEQLSDDALLCAALAHELAHLRHGDSLHPAADPSEMLIREVAADTAAEEMLRGAGLRPSAMSELLLLLADDQPAEWCAERLAALAESAAQP